MMTNGEAWIRILTDCNLTSHIYKEGTANEILDHIRTGYMEQFDALVRYFRNEQNRRSWCDVCDLAPAWAHSIY